jgi:hypothetical protein
MKHLNIFESWLSNLNPSKKEKVQEEEPPKDQFIAMGMEDPTDPKSQFKNYRKEIDSAKLYSEGIHKLIDVSKYYYFPDAYNGRGWLFNFVMHDLSWMLDDMEILKIDSERMDVEFLGHNMEPARATKFTLIEGEEPIVRILSYYSTLLGIWIPKEILFNYFKDEQSARESIKEVNELVSSMKNVKSYGFFDV